MSKKRKLILNLAVSLDGYIADMDGGFAWIKGDDDKSNDTKKAFDFEEFSNGIDTLVMGRKAYEDCPKETLGMFKDKKIYVATSKKLESEFKNIEFIHEGIYDKVLDLRDKEGKDVWIWGGAGLADSFIKGDVIDEYVIGIIPIILGSGRPLFLEENPTIELHMDECTSQEGVVILRYSKRS
jgi:dihydrofolate reductase